MEDLKEELTATARGHGAPLLGVVTPEAADRHAGIHVGWTINRPTVGVREVFAAVRSVVVVGLPIWDRTLDLAVRRPGGGWSYPGYLPMTLACRETAMALTGRGFRTHAAYAPLSYKNLAVEAGFGALGKSSLLVNALYGPGLRLGVILTDAELPPDRPEQRNLCGECRACLDACPAGALEPYRVDPGRCLVGVTLHPRPDSGLARLAERHEPRLSPHAHLMCRACQEACPYGRFRRDEPGWEGL